MNFLKDLNEFSKDFARIYEAYPMDISSKERDKLDWDLCSRGSIPEAELTKTYSRITGIKVREDDELVNLEKFPKISLEYLENFCFIPFKWDEKSVELIISSPYRVDNIAYVFKQLYGLDTTFSYGRRSVLERLIQETYNKEANEEEQGFGPADSEEALMNMATEAKIVRLVNEVFSRAVEMNASDIHVEPEENKYAIRFRIDGNLQEFMTGSINQYPAVASRIKLVGGLNIAESRLPQDGRTNIHLGKSEIDMRINTIPTLSGESIVLRLLRKDAMVFNLKNTGMLDDMRKRFENIITLPHGIILVVGPTGSGKSTTLYSIMSQLNTPEVKIITIEDPVEYRIPGLSQMQVNPKIGVNFASALRNIVRQDPDIILVGEIRDKETADIAINAALTGHLVLSTLHTNDAVGAISRLLDMGAEGFLIASSLVAVLSQRLVRRICKDCGGKSAKDHSIKCKTCGSTGFKGRVAIMELLVIDDEIRQAIIKNTDSSTLNKIAVKNGLIPINDDGMAKAKLGWTTEAEVYVAAKKEN